MKNALQTKGKSSRAGSSAEPAISDPVLHERIAVRAYGLFLNRGQIHGYDLQDWFQAEARILSELRSQGEGRGKTPQRLEPPFDTKARSPQRGASRPGAERQRPA